MILSDSLFVDKVTCITLHEKGHVDVTFLKTRAFLMFVYDC